MIKNMNNILKIIDFIRVVNALKFEMRFGKENENVENRDSVAAHTWRMSLLTFLLVEELDVKVDINKCIKMSLVHDLPESLVGDTAFSEVIYNKSRLKTKNIEEKEAMKKLAELLPEKLSEEVYSLWEEYEECKTNEAKFVKVMDKVEAAYQYIFMGMEKLKSKDASVMHSDKVYGFFDDTDEIIRLIRAEMKEDFESKGLPWKNEYNL